MRADACDCHCHIIDPRFPVPGAISRSAASRSAATLDDYLDYQRRIGTTKAVFVQTKLHGTDPTCLLDALQRMGPLARGIAVVLPDVTDGELRRLDCGGVRGLRFSVWNETDAVTTVAMIAPLASRIASLGWHAQIHMSAGQIIDNAVLLRSLPCPIVFDHMARIPADAGPAHPAFDVVGDLTAEGKAWIKLSGPYLNSSNEGYADTQDLARGFIERVPDRLVWGSDWPHVTETRKPQPAELLDLLRNWAPDEPARDRILVQNPKALYGFA